MNFITKKYLQILGGYWLGFIVLGGAFYFMMLKPKVEEYKSVEKLLAEKACEYDEARVAATNDSKKKIREKSTGRLGTLYSYCEDYDNAAQITFMVNEAADKLELKDFVSKTVYTSATRSSSSKNKEENKIEPRKISVSFVSDYRSFAEFINTLERSSPVVFIDSFHVEHGNRTAGNMISAKIDLDYYILNNPGEKKSTRMTTVTDSRREGNSPGEETAMYNSVNIR